MTSITTNNAYKLDTSSVQRIDLGQATSIAQASDEDYNRYVNVATQVLQGQYTSPADTTSNSSAKPYATVEVNGQVVASIDNRGQVSMSNGLAGQWSGQMPDTAAVGGKNGPALAQARSAFIAAQTGGNLVMQPTAQTQSEYDATAQPSAVVDYGAMALDPAYQQLQSLRQARTLYLAQQYGQG